MTLVLAHRGASWDAPGNTLAAFELAVEAKDGAAMKGILAALKAHRIATEDVLVLSFRIRDLWHAQRARPDLRYVLNLGRRPDPTAAARFWGVGFEDRSARPGRLALAGSLGLAVTVFTVNEPARMRELAALGVDGIFSDRPGLLRDVLETLAA